MKKAVSLALALTLCLALAMPAFAAGEYELGQDADFGRYGTGNRFTVDRKPVAENGRVENAMQYVVSPESVFTLTRTNDQMAEAIERERQMLLMYSSADARLFYTFQAEVGFLNENGLYSYYILDPKTGEFVPEDRSLDYGFSVRESLRFSEGQSISFKLPFDKLGDKLSFNIYLTFYDESWFPADADVSYMQQYEFINADVKQTDLLNIKFNDRSARMLDSGIAYSYTLTNNSDKAVNGYYALVAYDPKNSIWAYINSFDLTLGAGEKKSDTLVSGLWNMSRMKLVWVEFDDKAERDAFFADKRLFGGNGPYYSVNILDTKQWLQDALGITVNY